MRKTAFFLACLLLCLLVCTGCAAERHDLLYEIERDGVVYCVRGNGTQAKQIVIKKDGSLIWSQRVKVDREIGNLGGTYGFELQDLNFDGLLDLLIAVEKTKDCVSYVCWLRDADRLSFTESAELSGLCNIYADERLQAIFAFSQTAEARGENGYSTCDKTTKYVWEEGKLIPDMYAAINYYSGATQFPYCYSVAYYDAEIKDFKDSSDDWMTAEEYRSLDWDFLYYFKDSKK